MTAQPLMVPTPEVIGWMMFIQIGPACEQAWKEKAANLFSAPVTSFAGYWSTLRNPHRPDPRRLALGLIDNARICRDEDVKGLVPPHGSSPARLQFKLSKVQIRECDQRAGRGESC